MDTETVTTNDWQKLCESQMQRALAGDAKAAQWVAAHKPVEAGSDVEPVNDLEEMTLTERKKLSRFLLLRDSQLAHFPSGLLEWPRVIDAVEKLVHGEATPKDLRELGRAVANIGGLHCYARTVTPAFSDVSKNAEEDAKLQSILDALQLERESA